jgi:hypothetical protein
MKREGDKERRRVVEKEGNRVGCQSPVCQCVDEKKVWEINIY